ncbi:hypothetical protein [Mycobacterium shimoidei]|uniref:Uncharacterized protein n=1 Tax=Mycobacterium shimoidei TaxID=29313 RepID=A0A1E3TDE0_MYCSH|nr:hypothetical protein [Mycobacterium shimoidei]MCV7260854.1 hypothetical protein [Mycobacterium shimoidei]ODR12033.1 hypothetical protein BHQ16_17460 [Mycobacterium shimoidei]ORW79403.1 hypothetical protein AWC26_15270 [Mycobacterium shimoidei]SRX93027.1 hypothetical protein MSP7336_01257 [Mycobacterium shimoidei]
MTTLATDRLRWATPADRNRAELMALLTERTMATADPKRYTSAPTLTQAWYQAHMARWGLDSYLDKIDAVRA